MIDSRIQRAAVLFGGVCWSIFALLWTLDAANSAKELTQVVTFWVLFPVGLAITIVRPTWVVFPIFLLLVMKVQFFVGFARMPVLYPFFVLCVVAHVVRWLGAGGRLIDKRQLDPLLIVYVSVALVQYLASPVLPTFGIGTGSGFSAYATFFCSLLPFVFMSECVSKRAMERLPVNIMVACVVAIAFVSVVMLGPNMIVKNFFGAQDSIQYAQEGRYSFLATPATMLLAAGLAVGVFSKEGVRWLALGGALAGGFCVLLTGTRSLAFGACMGCFWVLVVKRKWLGLAVATATVVLLFGIRLAQPNAEGPIARVVLRSLSPLMVGESARGWERFKIRDSETLTWRVSVWREAWNVVKEHPVLGTGFGASTWGTRPIEFLSPSERDQVAVEGSLESGATHNLWLGPFVTFGVIAGLCFTLYVLKRTKSVLKRAFTISEGNPMTPTMQFLAVWLVIILGSSVTSGGTVATELWILLSVTVVLDGYVDEHEPPAGHEGAIGSWRAFSGTAPHEKPRTLVS